MLPLFMPSNCVGRKVSVGVSLLLNAAVCLYKMLRDKKKKKNRKQKAERRNVV